MPGTLTKSPQKTNVAKAEAAEARLAGAGVAKVGERGVRARAK